MMGGELYTPDALAQAVTEIRETHRKWAYYTARLSETLRDEGFASETYAYYRSLQQVHEDATQQEVGALLDALTEAEARATRAEAALEEITLICFEYPSTMPDHTLYATMTSLAADQATHILARRIGLAIKGVKTVADGRVREITSVADIRTDDGEDSEEAGR